MLIEHHTFKKHNFKIDETKCPFQSQGKQVLFTIISCSYAPYSSDWMTYCIFLLSLSVQHEVFGLNCQIEQPKKFYLFYIPSFEILPAQHVLYFQVFVTVKQRLMLDCITLFPTHWLIFSLSFGAYCHRVNF